MSEQHTHGPDSLLADDAILPSQFYASRRRDPEFEPYQRLFAAMFEDAVRCIKLKPEPRPEDAPPLSIFAKAVRARRWQCYLEASEWITGPEIPRNISFDAVCWALRMNTENTRAALANGNIVAAMKMLCKLPVAGWLTMNPDNRRSRREKA